MTLTGDERVIILEGAQPLHLDCTGTAWRVESGSAAVMAAEIENGSPRGRRRFLFDVSAGDFLLGLTPSAGARHTLIAVAVEPGVLAALDESSLDRVALDAWTARLAAAVEPAPATPETRDFFQALIELDRADETRARERLQQQQRLNDRLAVQALSDLAAPAETGSAAVPAAASELLAAAQTVGDAQGIVFRPPVGDVDSARDPVQAMALASGVRTRAVLLDHKWWTGEHGPLLAFRASDKSPVALIPAVRLFGRSRYDLVDPAAHTRVPVDDTAAASLDAMAYSFYRSIGARRGLKDVLAFGLRGLAKDARMMLFCGIAVTLLGMVAPQATALLFAHAIPDSDRSLLLQISLGMIAASLGAMFFDITRGVSALRIQTAVAAGLQSAAWDWLLKLSPSFLRKYSTGDLHTRLECLRRIQQLLTPEIQRALLVGVTAVLYLGLMLYYNAMLALLAALCAVTVIGVTAVCWILLDRLHDSALETEGRMTGLTVQLINGVAKIRVAGAEQRAFACWGRSYGRKQKLVERIQAIQDRLTLMNSTAPILAPAFSFCLAFSGKGVELGTFLAFNVALGGFMQAITRLSDATGELVSIATSWRRTKTILDAAPEVDEGKAHPGRLSGRISIEHVTFRYRKDGRQTLEDISLHADPGECIALVGPSGSGKSTILNLMLGFEMPASGAVLFDGHDLHGLDLTAVRRQIGVVHQDSRLMSQTIFENIVCGSRFTMEEAWEAAEAAGFADDIRSMPMGMHTMISEGGANLSGGQRQRLLIARALVIKPKILLFDEATSALDNRTQQIVTESLKRLQATRVVVAHRLSTIAHADRIYVLEAGRIVQQGSFADLSARPGLFARLMHRQVM
jgi:NHLM bacteriocin system ABC transporter ATP-binding protein